MENPSSESPFQDLPEALVEEMLGEYKRIGTELSTSLEKMESTREHTRGFLFKAGLLTRDSSILRSYSHQTTCGIDGAYAVELQQQWFSRQPETAIPSDYPLARTRSHLIRSLTRWLALIHHVTYQHLQVDNRSLDHYCRWNNFCYSIVLPTVERNFN